MTLQQEIEEIFGQDLVGAHRARATQLFNEFIFFLNRGEIRAADKVHGKWKVNSWVKKGILLGFQLGEMEEVVVSASVKFFEKHTYRLKNFPLSTASDSFLAVRQFGTEPMSHGEWSACRRCISTSARTLTRIR